MATCPSAKSEGSRRRKVIKKQEVMDALAFGADEEEAQPVDAQTFVGKSVAKDLIVGAGDGKQFVKKAVPIPIILPLVADAWSPVEGVKHRKECGEATAKNEVAKKLFHDSVPAAKKNRN